MMGLIFKNGGNPNQTLENGVTALMIAVSTGNAQLAEALIKAGAQIDAKNKDGQTALDLALKNSNPKIINLLKTATP